MPGPAKRSAASAMLMNIAGNTPTQMRKKRPVPVESRSRK
jgi:hypothetical protein